MNLSPHSSGSGNLQWVSEAHSQGVVRAVLLLEALGEDIFAFSRLHSLPAFLGLWSCLSSTCKASKLRPNPSRAAACLVLSSAFLFHDKNPCDHMGPSWAYLPISEVS